MDWESLWYVLIIVLSGIEVTTYVILKYPIRPMLTYAVNVAMLIFALAPLVAAMRRDFNDRWNRIHVKTAIVSSGIFLVFAQIVVGTTLSGTLKIILAIIGSLSFWTMFISFISYALKLPRNNTK